MQPNLRQFGIGSTRRFEPEGCIVWGAFRAVHASDCRTGRPGATEWIESFRRARWGAATIVLHREVTDAAGRPALIVTPEERRRLATHQLGRDAELVTLDADPTGVGTGAALIEHQTCFHCLIGMPVCGNSPAGRVKSGVPNPELTRFLW